MNPDFVDLLRAFIAADVRFLVGGPWQPVLKVWLHSTGDASSRAALLLQRHTFTTGC